MKKLALAAALLATVTGAQAYQVEVQGGSEYYDNTINDKTFTGAVAATYYFKDVDSTKGPLAEAAFLNQASSLNAAYHYVKYDDSFGTDVENHNYGAKGEAYYATPVAPIYASASYTHTRSDAKNNDADSLAENGDGDRWAVELGALPISNFLLAVGYTSVKDQNSYDVLGLVNQGLIPAIYETITIGEDQDAITARAKYVGAIDGTNMSIGFEAGYLKGDNSQFQFKSDLYLTPKLSVGGIYQDSSVNNTNKDAIYGGNINYFVTPAIAVGATYVNANTVAGENTDSQTYGLNLKARF